jgi:hypothetical protein
MKDLEVPPSVVTYSSAMHAWTKARLVTKTDSSKQTGLSHWEYWEWGFMKI